MAYELLHGRAPLVAHAIEMQCWVKLAERKAKETKGYRVPKMAIKVLEDSFAKLTDVEQAAVLSLTKSHTMPEWHRWDEFCRLFGPSEAARQRRSERRLGIGCRTVCNSASRFLQIALTWTKPPSEFWGSDVAAHVLLGWHQAMQLCQTRGIEQQSRHTQMVCLSLSRGLGATWYGYHSPGPKVRLQ